ncbi:UNVERIFIED_CONTAM: hypothetical protein GTU68_048303 [Idotea baltica]|nr:hypothetical protein [Idotea baltica]
MSSTSAITICPSNAAFVAQAKSLAQRYQLTYSGDILDNAYQLRVTTQGLAFFSPELGNPITIDFTQGKSAHRRQYGGGRGQALAKAIGLKKGVTPSVIDATAGYGQDAFVLATLGCQMILLERNPILAALLEDGLIRAEADSTTSNISQQMRVYHRDASDYLQQLTSDHRPDVIYLDPMYPTRQKSALVKKEMQLLHYLVGADIGSENLLAIARKTAKKRVVVKRPKSAQPIMGDTPTTVIESKNTRYDVYIMTS